MKKACIQVNNNVWTLTYTENKNGTISINNFDQGDNDGYMFRENLGILDYIKETEGRIVDKVSINGQEYDVDNKQNVYTYKLPL